MQLPLLIELHYLPCIPYLHTLIQYDKVVFEAQEYLIKQTYRNRTRIYGANGPLDLIIPLKNKSAKIPVKEVEIIYAGKWQHTHHMAVHSAYKSSPYYSYFEDELERLFFTSPKYLFEYNRLWLDWICKTLRISVDYSFSEEYVGTENSAYADLRNTIGPKIISDFTHPHYRQVFEDKHGFIPNLCILDWIFNDLPGARNYCISS